LAAHDYHELRAAHSRRNISIGELDQALSGEFSVSSDHEKFCTSHFEYKTSCVETDNTEYHLVPINKTGGGESMRVSRGRASGNRR